MDAHGFNWHVLMPVAAVAVGSLAVLVLEVLLSRRTGELTPPARAASERRLALLLAFIASFSLLIALVASYVLLLAGVDTAFDPQNAMLRIDGLSGMAIGIVSMGALLSVWLSSTYLMALHINHGEYYALLLLAVTGMFIALCAENLMLLFMGVELMSIPAYALAAFDRSKLRSNEAGLKYFLLGSFASAIFLYGIALLYGATGRLDYAGLQRTIDPSSTLAMAGLALLLVGFAFKLALVPFHQYVPDVYEGAPTPVTAFISVCVKTTAVFVLLRLLLQALPDLAGLLRPIFWLLAVASIVVGNLMAIVQRNVKRMLAYSSIAHAGYLMLALVSETPEAYGAMIFYLLAYVFMNLGAFGVVIALAARGRDCERIEDFAGIASRRPGLAAVMTLFMLALAGMPGTVGFWAKFHLFESALEADEVALVIVAILGSVVSFYYYLRVPVEMYMRDASEEEPTHASTNELAVLLACAGVVLYLGFFPNARLPGHAAGLLDVLRATVGM